MLFEDTRSKDLHNNTYTIFVLSLWFNSFNNLQFKWTHYNNIALRLQLKNFMNENIKQSLSINDMLK